MPDGFLWGSSTSGHQIEGNNIHSGHWKAELENEKTQDDFQASGMACNHYELYREDIEMLKDLKHQAFRMSVEWSRIEPVEGKFEEKEVEHYVDVLKRLKENGIQVFLTLVHFTVPAWFEDKGGFSTMDNLQYFERYLHFIVPKIAPYVSFWNTLNEVNHPGYESRMKINWLKYHARAYHVIKAYTDTPVSIAHAFHFYMPKRHYDAFDEVMAKYYDLISNEYLLHAIRTGEIVHPFEEAEWYPEVKDTCDYWSVNWYTRDLIDARDPAFVSTKYRHNEMKLIPRCAYFDEVFAEGMMAVLTRLRDKPVYITENGCCTYDDNIRIVYIAQVLSSIRDAIDAGVDVKGYLYWSLLDNYEWYSFEPQFGMVGCDFKTFERTPKPSALFYRDMIEANGFDQEILRKYLDHIPSLSLDGNR